jgi:hypothetical protein
LRERLCVGKRKLLESTLPTASAGITLCSRHLLAPYNYAEKGLICSNKARFQVCGDRMWQGDVLHLGRFYIKDMLVCHVILHRKVVIMLKIGSKLGQISIVYHKNNS